MTTLQVKYKTADSFGDYFQENLIEINEPLFDDQELDRQKAMSDWEDERMERIRRAVSSEMDEEHRLISIESFVEIRDI